MTDLDHAQVAAAPSWGVVVPVKRLAVAKSRLRVVGERGRQELALAFAEDVVLAALGCPAVIRVLVVTDDVVARSALLALGADVCPDRPGAGLNEALEHGARQVRAGAGLGVVAVSADLPALRSADLTALLRATVDRAVVADAGGTGTTLLAAAPGRALDPLFGDGSLARHVASGAALLDGPPGARRDVDTLDDLREALRLGVGPRTTAVAASLDVLAAGLRASPVAAQGTMHP